MVNPISNNMFSNNEVILNSLSNLVTEQPTPAQITAATGDSKHPNRRRLPSR